MNPLLVLQIILAAAQAMPEVIAAAQAVIALIQANKGVAAPVHVALANALVQHTASVLPKADASGLGTVSAGPARI